MLATAAVQMLVAGTVGGRISRPIRLPIQTASGGRNFGALNKITTSTRTLTPTRTGCPSSLAPVTITIAVPVARLTVCIITEEPAAASAESPRPLAITPIAVSDQIFPGTYFPRFERNQIRAACGNGRCESHAPSTRRHPSIRSAYANNTRTVAAPIHCHPNWMCDRRGSTLFH